MSARYETMQLVLLGLIAAGVTDAKWLRTLLYIWAGYMGALVAVMNMAYIAEAIR